MEAAAEEAGVEAAAEEAGVEAAAEGAGVEAAAEESVADAMATRRSCRWSRIISRSLIEREICRGGRVTSVISNVYTLELDPPKANARGRMVTLSLALASRRWLAGFEDW